MAGVDVDEVAVELELAVDHRHEAAGQRALVDDVVEALHRAHDLEVAGQPHAQPHVDVAHLQRRRQAVAGDVGDRQAEDLRADRDVVEEVAAHLVHRLGVAEDLEVAVDRLALGQDRDLNLPRLVEDAHHPLLADLLVDAVAQDAEREQQIVAVAAGGDVEGQQVLLVADLDGGELLNVEVLLEVGIDAVVVAAHVDGALLEQPLDRRVAARHPDLGVDRFGVREGRQEQVVLALPLVQAAAVDAQLAAELGDQPLDHHVDGLPDVVGALDGGDHLLDLLHQLAVVDGSGLGGGHGGFPTLGR